jgi:hypothetical protein
MPASICVNRRREDITVRLGQRTAARLMRNPSGKILQRAKPDQPGLAGKTMRFYAIER